MIGLENVPPREYNIPISVMVKQEEKYGAFNYNRDG